MATTHTTTTDLAASKVFSAIRPKDRYKAKQKLKRMGINPAGIIATVRVGSKVQFFTKESGSIPAFSLPASDFATADHWC